MTDGVLVHPHRRFDPLTEEWVLVSAGRTQRPWRGGRESASAEPKPRYDPGCYLCPGNVRANGERNPAYESTFVFRNDYAALQPDSPVDRVADGLRIAQGENGTCLVLCFSPRHDLTLAQMDAPDVRHVIDTWADVSASLGAHYPWVQVFENRGAAMGASNPHPHGQIWAAGHIPSRATREDRSQRAYFEQNGRPLLLDYALQEDGQARTVVSDDEWLIVVPFWAAWPYEALIIPRRPASRLPDLDDRQRETLTTDLVSLLRRYDSLFAVPFPYSMGWHQAPFDDSDPSHWQLHGHVYPPLLRADQRKFMVGYELLSELQRDITPEFAADQLRAALDRTA